MTENEPGLFVVQRVGDVDIVEFMDEALIDQATIERMGRDLQELVAKAGHPKLIISFTNVHSVSSAVLGVLIATNKQVKKLRGELRLASIPDRVFEVFRLTRLDKMLKIYKTADEAMVKF
jgi:anti-sigma B factor antagonist